jgi:hypothetical protein
MQHKVHFLAILADLVESWCIQEIPVGDKKLQGKVHLAILADLVEF